MLIARSAADDYRLEKVPHAVTFPSYPFLLYRYRYRHTEGYSSSAISMPSQQRIAAPIGAPRDRSVLVSLALARIYESHPVRLVWHGTGIIGWLWRWLRPHMHDGFSPTCNHSAGGERLRKPLFREALEASHEARKASHEALRALTEEA